MSHAKLYARVTESSLMSADVDVRYVFAFLLPMADKKGFIIGTDERLALRLNIDLARFQNALAVLTSPDPQSSSKAHEGRRLLATSEPRGYQIVNYRAYQGMKPTRDEAEADPERCPKNEFSLKVAAINNRRPTTPWADNEIAAFKQLMRIKAFTMEDLDIVHRYYVSERKRVDQRTGQPCGYHRRNLITFLNNYLGELDRARAWAVSNPKAAAKPVPSANQTPAAPVQEPPGFREWFTTTYPRANPSIRFAEIPEDIRQQFQPQEAA